MTKQVAVADDITASSAGYGRTQEISLYQIINEKMKFHVDLLMTDTATRDELDSDAKDLFQLFLAREQEYEFEPAVVTEYPDISDPRTSAFLNSPLLQIAKRCHALDGDSSFGVEITYPNGCGR